MPKTTEHLTIIHYIDTSEGVSAYIELIYSGYITLVLLLCDSCPHGSAYGLCFHILSPGLDAFWKLKAKISLRLLIVQHWAPYLQNCPSHGQDSAYQVSLLGQQSLQHVWNGHQKPPVYHWSWPESDLGGGGFPTYILKTRLAPSLPPHFHILYASEAQILVFNNYFKYYLHETRD